MLEQESKEMRDVAELSTGHPKEHLDKNSLSSDVVGLVASQLTSQGLK